MFLTKSTNLPADTIRKVHTTSLLCKSHYDSLGITPRATQGDIKNAYYKLSMMYHPDKNSGSEIAAKKFRDINAAYEVLGNLRLRKLYDKGIWRDELKGGAPVSEDDTRNKFYKSHVHHAQPPGNRSRDPIYNFDEWSKSHYGASFKRKLMSKRKYEEKLQHHITRENAAKSENVIFGFTFLSAVVILLSYTLRNPDYDNVSEMVVVQQPTTDLER